MASQSCSTCPPIRPRQAWDDPCTCGERLYRHLDLSHPPIHLDRGVTCYGQSHAGACRHCDCGRFRLKGA